MKMTLGTMGVVAGKEIVWTAKEEGSPSKKMLPLDRGKDWKTNFPSWWCCPRPYYLCSTESHSPFSSEGCKSQHSPLPLVPRERKEGRRHKCSRSAPFYCQHNTVYVPKITKVYEMPSQQRVHQTLDRRRTSTVSHWTSYGENCHTVFQGCP